MKEIKIEKYKGSLIFKISIIALCIFTLITIFTQYNRIVGMKSELGTYNSEIAVQELNNKLIQEAMEDSKYNKEEFAEEYARNEFDYAKQEERVFVNIGGN